MPMQAHYCTRDYNKAWRAVVIHCKKYFSIGKCLVPDTIRASLDRLHAATEHATTKATTVSAIY